MILIVVTLFAPILANVIFRPFGPPILRNIDFREIYFPRLIDTVYVEKPPNGVSVTTGENPVETENVFSPIFVPVPQDQEEQKGLIDDALSIFNQIKDNALNFVADKVSQVVGNIAGKLG